MRKFLLLIVILTALISQEKIVVYLSSDQSRMADFEKELIFLLTELYTKTTKNVIPISVEPITDFGKHLRDFKEEKDPTILYLSINIISITKERALIYDISHSYMPNKYVLLGKKTFKNIVGKKSAYLTGTILEDVAKKVGETEKLIIVPFNTRQERLEAFFKGDVDILITDYVDSWTFDLKIIKGIEYYPKDFYGIFLVKGNPYNKKFLEITNYYLTSLAYFKLIKKHFGESAVRYFKSNQN